jgi:hypothetical protein
MKPSPILISLDSNERCSERAKALAQAVGGDPTYELDGFFELPVDMRISKLQEEPDVYASVHVELKEIPDFWASKSSGHLGQQVLEMISEGEPGFVAVFGSLQEVLAGVPKVANGGGKPMRRGQMAIQQDLSTARAFSADAAACNVPVFFLSTNHEQSFRWILSYAKHILTGPSLASWLPRFDVDARSYGILCSIPGVGDAAAKGLLAAYGGIAQIVNDCKFCPDGLAETKVNGKKLGKSKASAIIRAMGCEIPGAWA